MKINSVQKILLVYLLFLLFYWVILFQSGQQTSIWNYLFSFCFSLIPLIGGVIGVFLSKSWGFLSSSIGKAIFCISTGLFLWGLGSMIWAYYNIFLNDPVPYPSLADAAYIFSYPLWAIGIINLSHAVGIKYPLRKIKGKLFLLVIPLVLIIFSYYLQVVVARGGYISDLSGGYLKIFFDLAYPIGGLFILTLAVLTYGLSINYLGGKFKYTILIVLLGFVLNYIGDLIFTYTTTIETFYTGDFGDLIYAFAFFLLTFGTLGFNKELV